MIFKKKIQILKKVHEIIKKEKGKIKNLAKTMYEETKEKKTEKPLWNLNW